MKSEENWALIFVHYTVLLLVVHLVCYVIFWLFLLEVKCFLHWQKEKSRKVNEMVLDLGLQKKKQDLRAKIKKIII